MGPRFVIVAEGGNCLVDTVLVKGMVRKWVKECSVSCLAALTLHLGNVMNQASVSSMRWSSDVSAGNWGFWALAPKGFGLTVFISRIHSSEAALRAAFHTLACPQPNIRGQTWGSDVRSSKPCQTILRPIVILKHVFG